MTRVDAMYYCTPYAFVYIYIKSPGKTTIGLKGHWRFEEVTVLKKQLKIPFVHKSRSKRLESYKKVCKNQ